MSLRTPAAFVVLWSLATLTSCSTDEAQWPSDDVLAATVRVRLAEKIFSLPVAEVNSIGKPGNESIPLYSPQDTDIGKDEAERLARDMRGSAPITAATLEISRIPYSDLFACKRKLSWFCRAERAGVDADLPTKFQIIDTRYLKRFEGKTSTGQRFSDDLEAASRLPQQPAVACGTTEFCIATMRLSPGLIALWNSYPRKDPTETPREMAEREGRALARVVNGS